MVSVRALLRWGRQSTGRLGGPEKDLVLGFFADSGAADEAIRRIRGRHFFRSARVSVTSEGQRSIGSYRCAAYIFAALLASLILIPSALNGNPLLPSLIGGGAVFAAAILLAPRFGLSIAKPVVREFAARVLPGESLVLAQCDSRDTRTLSDLLHFSESSKPAVFIIRPYLPEPLKALRIDRELLSAEQLRRHAVLCAKKHKQASPSKPGKSILYYLSGWERMIEAARRDLTEAVELQQSVTTSAEWLLDNAYVIRNHINDIRRNLPHRYYRFLPRIDGESGDLNLRVLRLALELSGKTDGSISAASIYNFLSSYQGPSPLTIAELWVFPLMIRYALIVDLAHQSLRVSRRQHDRERADFWANRLLSAAHRKPDAIPEILRDIAGSMPALPPHFLIRLMGQLSEEETAFSAAQAWLGDKLESPLPDTIRGEHSRQTRKQLSIANDIGSLRRLTQLDWRDIFESLSLVEAILEQDAVYSESDFNTRDRCRRAVEEIARYAENSELDVSRKAIQLATERQPDERCGNTAYFLIGKGRSELENCFGCCLPYHTRCLRWLLENAGAVYFSSICAITAALLGFGVLAAEKGGAPVGLSIGFVLLAIWPASEVATQLVNYLVCLFVPPRLIPRLSFKSGIPEDCRTLIVVPAMLLTPDSVKDDVDRLEVRYLANPEPNLLFALLTDFTDAESATTPEDQRLYEIAMNGITELNAHYGNDRFFLFHRERTWCETEKKWIGWERKRGKLEDLTRFLCEEPREGLGTFLRAGNRLQLKGIRYIITLDADTELPHQAALHLIEAMAHPLNRPVISPERRVVIEGYGIIQPRVVTSLPAATATFFSYLFSHAKGTDPYAQAVSDLNQDLFGEGIFIGKAIFDVRAFQQVLSGRFPSQRLLSHDLIEGNYLRAAFDSTIVLFENFPANYESFNHRQHRWIRGDWQIAEWLFSSVPLGNGGRERNPLSAVGRWKIFDNLRRSVIPIACCLVLTGSWLLLPKSLFWNIFVAFALLIPALVPIPTRVREGARGHFFVMRDQGLEFLRGLITIALLPYQAWIAADAIVRVWFRRFVSGTHLLQWETAQSIHWRYRNSTEIRWRNFAVCLGAGALILLLYYVEFSAWIVAIPYLSLWLISPATAYWINAPVSRRKTKEWTESDRLYVRRIARETWRFFDDLVGPESHWLPPDNSQESIRVEVAYRTSPTNIGLWLVSALAARDFGYLTIDEIVDRLSVSLDTIDSLEKFRGHLLNWYDIKTLEPLRPKYVSTVDSGNLIASLWTVGQGLLELMKNPVFGRECLEGTADVLSILKTELQKLPFLPGDIKIKLEVLGQSGRGDCSGLQACWAEIQSIKAAFVQLKPVAAGYIAAAEDAGVAREISYWLEQLDKTVQSQDSILNRYFGWVPLLIDIPGGIQASARLIHLRDQLLEAPSPSLESLAQNNGLPAVLESEIEGLPENREWAVRICDEIKQARTHAREALSRMRAVQERIDTLQEGMRLGFLYDPDRKIFSIGHDVNETSPGSSYYDLLASEARLTSIIAIARGEVEPEHWQALGRPFGVFGSRRVLYSWSGSMFEYLMPLLFARTFEESLLHHACEEAVAAHIEYGKRRGVPWGISESAFSALDSNQIYQYRAFGVPALALKRGLEEDLVIAPYSTALALMVKPVQAVQNMKALEKAGLHGSRGFYESIDYSRESREGAHGAIVCAYMAHHQGMSFLAMNNAIFNGRIQKRFHSDLRVRAAESLLYEGIPSYKIASYLNTAEVRTPARLITATAETTITGRSITENTPIPKTHLLSNGAYSLMITNSGGGYSRWREYDLTRWRADTTRDHWGSFCYMRDLDAGAVWSATFHPTDRADTDYSVTYHSDRVEFKNSLNGIDSVCEVTVSPEDDLEVRRIVLVNRSGERRRIDLTSYCELVLAPHAADRAHPAFNKMFVQTEKLPERSALIASRHSNEGERSPVWAGHALVSAPGMKTQFESSRRQFIGRGRSPARPVALTRDLSNSSGHVLDPIFSIRKEVTLEQDEAARFALITLAAESKEALLHLIDKYRDMEAVDRVFEIAWMHAQLSFRYLQIQQEDALRFQDLAARLIYPSAGLRPGTERLRRNSLGQSRLWAFGISGDLPISVLVVSDPLDLGTVREMLQAHSFWNERGLKSDLLILNSEAGGYDQPLQHRLMKLIQIHSVTTGIDKPGGVFLRPAEQLSGEDLTLLLSCAHIVLFASRGSVGRQLSRQPEPPANPPPIRPVASPFEEVERTAALPSLTYFNGIGGFNEDGREYVICLEGDRIPPAPWINILANPDYGSLVDETGQGFSWHVNSQLNRITPWHNDPVSVDTSSGIYVRDEDTGAFWSPAAAPVRESTPYQIYHGQGYTRIEHSSHGVGHKIVTFVPADDAGGDPVRLQYLELSNQTSRPRSLTVTFYAEWVLGRDREETQLHIITNWDPVSSALLARNSYSSSFSRQIAFASVRPAAASHTADRMEFLGRNGSALNPAALGRSFLSGRTGAKLDPCAALQVRLNLSPGQRAEVAFMLGQAESIHEVRRVIDNYSDVQKVRTALDETTRWWDKTLGALQVSTPEKSADFLMNRWLMYQTLSCRIWGRSALYQSGGAFGFRDQLQDVMAVVYAKPSVAREQILKAAGHQFLEGDVQHWWHPESGAGVRTRCSDDLLWLPYATAHYVEVTGDAAILDERIPFIEGQPLGEGELETYFSPSVSMTDGTLFEHCRRAVEKGLTAGSHGLPLIGLCDWNDGFNRVGAAGKGESVWLAWFLMEVLRAFRQLCTIKNLNNIAELCDQRIRRLESAVEQNGWDGEWYRRAYFDDGIPLGSHINDECRIDSLAQSWAVISGSAPAERADRALHAVEEHLILDSDRLVLLFAPPFENSEKNPGYVRAYPPGVRENGGQYTHAAVWVALAYARMGNGKRAVDLLRMLNPAELTRSPAGMARYRCEPYVLAGDVYSLLDHVGQGGWTWYTGSSAWMYRVWIEEVLGFRLQGRTLTIDPTIPAQWPGFSIDYRYGRSVYKIEVRNPERTGRGVISLQMDGRRLTDRLIPLEDDALSHSILIHLGRGRT